MLISQGAARNERINLNLACSLAMIAGALNAAAFYAVGFFSANMTGNVSSLSDHLATAHWGQAVFFFTVIIIFILGAAISSLLINSGRRRGIAAIYAYSILLEAILLAVLGIADIWFLAMWRPPLLTLGLAFLMGLQNATVTRISDARVRTTHVSGMATDVGIELGIALDILRGREPDTYAFLVGGILGVFAYQHVGGYLLLICAVSLFVISLKGIRLKRKPYATSGTRRIRLPRRNSR